MVIYELAKRKLNSKKQATLENTTGARLQLTNSEQSLQSADNNSKITQTTDTKTNPTQSNAEATQAPTLQQKEEPTKQKTIQTKRYLISKKTEILSRFFVITMKVLNRKFESCSSRAKIVVDITVIDCARDKNIPNTISKRGTRRTEPIVIS